MSILRVNALESITTGKQVAVDELTGGKAVINKYPDVGDTGSTMVQYVTVVNSGTLYVTAHFTLNNYNEWYLNDTGDGYTMRGTSIAPAFYPAGIGSVVQITIDGVTKYTRGINHGTQFPLSVVASSEVFSGTIVEVKLEITPTREDGVNEYLSGTHPSDIYMNSIVYGA